MTTRDILNGSDLFDRDFYLETYRDVAAAGVDPVEHYLVYGWREGRRPHPSFDGQWYSRHYADAVQSDENPLVHHLTRGRFEGRRASKHAVIYTAIVGNYDELRPPAVVDSEIDYMAFVDDWIIDVPQPWIRRRIPSMLRTDRLTSRYVKVHAHEELAPYDISMWVDASFRLGSVRKERIEQLLGAHAIALFSHPDRECPFDEARVVRELGLDAPEAIDTVVRTLQQQGYVPGSGLAATGVILRRHHDSRLRGAMARWWHLISEGSERDQLSINFALREEGIAYARLPGSLWRNELVEWLGHRPPSWNGLQCGGAYIDAEEYEALEDIVRSLEIRSVVEMGAGETSIFFSRLGAQTVSIETTPGPWSRRAASHGCRVVEVSFDTRTARFSSDGLKAALQLQPQFDLLFVDAPVGLENRRNVVSQILEHVTVRYVAYHDVRRDLRNILEDQARLQLRPVRFVDSPRGLAVFAVDGCFPLNIQVSGGRGPGGI